MAQNIYDKPEFFTATANSGDPCMDSPALPNGRQSAQCCPTSGTCASWISVAASAGSPAGAGERRAHVLGLTSPKK